MTTSSGTRTPDDQSLAALLPLIASSWESGDLTDVEIAAVCMALIRDPGIDVSCKEALQRSLEAYSPVAQELQAWAATQRAP